MWGIKASPPMIRKKKKIILGQQNLHLFTRQNWCWMKSTYERKSVTASKIKKTQEMPLHTAVDQEVRFIYLGRCLFQYLMLNRLLLRIVNTSYSLVWSEEKEKSSELILKQMLILYRETLLITLCSLSSRKIDLIFCCGIFQNYPFSFKLLEQRGFHHFLCKMSLYVIRSLVCNYLSIQQEIACLAWASPPTLETRKESIVCMEKFKQREPPCRRCPYPKHCWDLWSRSYTNNLFPRHYD